ncbi:MAG: hypothetical protein IJX98_04660, partial [Clostridia bacterium]|nr:hypothetical protein [Clostridia bacterium]
MTKRMNRRLAAVLFGGFMVTLSLGAFSLVASPAKAESNGFYMEKGAGIRLARATDENYETSNGIRFTTRLSESYYTTLQQTYSGKEINFYTIVTTQPVADIEALTYDLVKNEVGSPTQSVSWTPTFTNGEYTEYTALVNWPTDVYRNVITARSCAEVVGAGENGASLYLYAASNDNSRSMAGVASAAVYDGEVTKTQVANYLGSDLGSSDFGGYIVGDEETSTLTLSGLSASAVQNPVVIVDAKTVDATVSGDQIVLNGAVEGLQGGETYNLAVIGDNGLFTSSVSYVDSVIDSGKVIELKTSQSAVVSLPNTVNEVVSATLGGVDVFGSFENGALTIDKTKIPNTAASLGEDTEIFVSCDTGAYLVKADVYTKVLRTADDLDKIFTEYALKEKVGALTYSSTTNDVYSYDGYFVLGDNIDYGGNTYQNGVISLSLNQCWTGNAVNITPYVGFKGTFDGKGFAVSNIAFASSVNQQFITSSGLFGAIAQTGVVKNLSLSVNSLKEVEGASSVASLLSGTLDNLSVTTPIAGTNSGNRSGCLVHATYGATLKNIFLNLTGTNGVRQYYGYISHFDYSVNDRATTAKNVYVARAQGGQALVSASMKEVGNPYYSGGSGAFKDVMVYHNVKFNNTSYTDPTVDTNYADFTNLTFKAYSDLTTDMANGTIAFDDTTYWNMTGDYPVFNAKEAAVSDLALSYTPVVEIYGATATVDLTEVADSFTAVSGAKIAGVDVFASYSDGVLTLNNASIPNASSRIGKNTPIVLLTDGGQYEIKANVYTKIITSAEELDKMLTEYATKTSVGTAKRAISVELFSYDGYFVLGNDIDYSEESARGVYNSGVSYLRTNYYAYNGANPAVINEAGFKGIFDGQGYAIENIEFSTTVNGSDGCFYTGGGLFGSIATTGLVKNLA